MAPFPLRLSAFLVQRVRLRFCWRALELLRLIAASVGASAVRAFPSLLLHFHPSVSVVTQAASPPHHWLNDSDLIGNRGAAQRGVYRRAPASPRAFAAAITSPQAARSEPAAHNKQAGGAGRPRCWRQRAGAAWGPVDGDAASANTDESAPTLCDAEGERSPHGDPHVHEPTRARRGAQATLTHGAPDSEALYKVTDADGCGRMQPKQRCCSELVPSVTVMLVLTRREEDWLSLRL